MTNEIEKQCALLFRYFGETIALEMGHNLSATLEKMDKEALLNGLDWTDPMHVDRLLSSVGKTLADNNYFKEQAEEWLSMLSKLRNVTIALAKEQHAHSETRSQFAEKIKPLKYPTYPEQVEQQKKTITTLQDTVHGLHVQLTDRHTTTESIAFKADNTKLRMQLEISDNSRQFLEKQNSCWHRYYARLKRYCDYLKTSLEQRDEVIIKEKDKLIEELRNQLRETNAQVQRRAALLKDKS